MMTLSMKSMLIKSSSHEPGLDNTVQWCFWEDIERTSLIIADTILSISDDNFTFVKFDLQTPFFVDPGSYEEEYCVGVYVFLLMHCLDRFGARQTSYTEVIDKLLHACSG